MVFIKILQQFKELKQDFINQELIYLVVIMEYNLTVILKVMELVFL